jgi:hypothetical protein
MHHSSRIPSFRHLLHELFELALGRDPLTRLRRRENDAGDVAGGVQRHIVLDFFDGAQTV